VNLVIRFVQPAYPEHICCTDAAACRVRFLNLSVDGTAAGAFTLGMSRPCVSFIVSELRPHFLSVAREVRQALLVTVGKRDTQKWKRGPRRAWATAPLGAWREV
jgi:hypothetical protein